MINLDTVFVEITNKCDKNCKHCFNANFNNIIPSEISISDLKVLLSFLKSIGVNKLKIVGGEPAFHSNFQEVLNELESSSIRYIIFSNHEMITNHLVSFNKSTNLSHIRISIDGNQRIHDYIRGAGNYMKMIDTIKELKHFKVPVKINYTINKLNYKCIDEVYKVACSLGVDISFSVMKICKNTFSEELLFDEKEIVGLLAELKDIKCFEPTISTNILKDIADNEVFISSQKSHSDFKHIGCLAGQKNCVIDSYGNVWPCSLLKGEEQYNYGNIFNDNPFEIIETMNNEWSSFCRTFTNCDECNYFSTCTGGCRSNAYYSGGIESKDPNCNIYSNLYYMLERK